jgi:ribonucleotide reductase alpha subunit
MNNRWEEFANWLIMPEDQRNRLNLPKNQMEYAKAHDISDRQLRRWKSDPVFQALVDKKKNTRNRGLAAVAVDGSPAVLDDSVFLEEDSVESPEEEYQTIKSTLVKGAMTGDPKYLDMYFRTYGKDFVAEEAAARSSDLSGLDLSDLIVSAVSELDIESVVSHLEALGYTVDGPGVDGGDSGER